MRRSTRIALLTAPMAMAMALGSSAAIAGEVNGNGDPTPIDSYRAGSICSFSGLNDNPDDPALFEGGRVQSFGDIVQEAIDVLGDGKGASALVPIIAGDGPGAHCKGYASGR